MSDDFFDLLANKSLLEGAIDDLACATGPLLPAEQDMAAWLLSRLDHTVDALSCRGPLQVQREKSRGPE